MYQKDALLKVAEKRHEVSADPWSVGVSGGVRPALGSQSSRNLHWADEGCPPAGTITQQFVPTVGGMCWSGL